MQVRLLFFAVLRDIAGTSEARIDVPAGTRARDVWASLREKHRDLARYVQPPMTAINQAYASPDAVLSDGDELAFIPPVAGG